LPLPRELVRKLSWSGSLNKRRWKQPPSVTLLTRLQFSHPLMHYIYLMFPLSHLRLSFHACFHPFSPLIYVHARSSLGSFQWLSGHLSHHNPVSNQSPILNKNGVIKSIWFSWLDSEVKIHDKQVRWKLYASFYVDFGWDHVGR
jgi:hypothetical protein